MSKKSASSRQNRLSVANSNCLNQAAPADGQEPHEQQQQQPQMHANNQDLSSGKSSRPGEQPATKRLRLGLNSAGQRAAQENNSAAAPAAEEQHPPDDNNDNQQQQTIANSNLAAKQSGGPLNICAACLKPIKERYLLMALEKKWHEDCLKCACCDCRLGEVGSSLFTHSDKILCRRDFLRIFGQKGLCAACKQTIPPYELVMRANENAYHMDCFACQQCQYRFCVGDRFHLTELHKIICIMCFGEQQQRQQQSLSSSSAAASQPQASQQQPAEPPEQQQQSQSQPDQQVIVKSEFPADSDEATLVPGDQQQPLEQPQAGPLHKTPAAKQPAAHQQQQQQACAM